MTRKNKKRILEELELLEKQMDEFDEYLELMNEILSDEEVLEKI